MHAFISHNKEDKAEARLLATALVQAGASVWFDEWDVAPGDSLILGIEQGLENCDALILMWSDAAAKSKWVGTELRAFLRRRVDNGRLRIIPIKLGDAPLPTLVSEYKGFVLTTIADLNDIAEEIVGTKSHLEVAKAIQERLWTLSNDKIPEGSPHKYIICPQCGGEVTHSFFYDPYKEKNLASVMCKECKFLASQFV